MRYVTIGLLSDDIWSVRGGKNVIIGLPLTHIVQLQDVGTMS
jgi:hypothetical protein